mgnify:CR=1 FL=1
MEINFKGPVMPIDPYSQLAFVEILNIILTAGHIVDVNRFLIRRNVNPRFGSLSGYFRWSFAEDRSGNVRTTTPRCVSATGYWTCPSVSWPQKTTGKKLNY